MIKDLNQEGRARLRALITKCDTGRTGKGTPYLSLTLEDKTGQLDAKFWNLTEEQTRQYKAGQVVEASGDIILHRNAVQLRVRHLDVVPDADILGFVREAPADRDTMDRMLSRLLESMNPGVYRDITCDLIDQRRKAFLTWPAATKNHHNYVGGLAWHTLSMAKAADALLPLYPFLDRDLLMAGILLHDLGKTEELSAPMLAEWHTLSMAKAADALLPLYPFLDRDLLMAGILLHDLGKTEELSAPMLAEYTSEGNLVGHISMTAGWIDEAAVRTGHAGKEDKEQRILLKHMVLSHHGKLEFGSPVMPMIPEAEMLSLVDDLDARMFMMKQSMDATAPGHFGPRVFALDNRMIYRPTQFGEQASAAADNGKEKRNDGGTQA